MSSEPGVSPHAVDLTLLRSALESHGFCGPGTGIYEDSLIAQFYAPVDHITGGARIVLVGITPGRQQGEASTGAYLQARKEGCTIDDALRAAKKAGAFAGTMRTNLCRMLDQAGLPELLGTSDSAALFTESCDLLHSTSLVRWPTFTTRRGLTNYTGASPRLERHPWLRQCVIDVFGAELEALGDDCVLIPLGKAVETALHHLAGELPACVMRKVQGLPHPSGANGHRYLQWPNVLPWVRAQLHRLLS